MRISSRTRSLFKYVSLAASALTFAVTAGSFVRAVALYNTPGDFAVELDRGILRFIWWDLGTLHDPFTHINYGPRLFTRPAGRPPLSMETWCPTIVRYALVVGSMPDGYLAIPPWIPLLLVGLPTAILWYRGYRPAVGHCQHCGYNLTGNVSGVCPECGTPAKQESQTP